VADPESLYAIRVDLAFRQARHFLAVDAEDHVIALNLYGQRVLLFPIRPFLDDGGVRGPAHNRRRRRAHPVGDEILPRLANQKIRIGRRGAHIGPADHQSIRNRMRGFLDLRQTRRVGVVPGFGPVVAPHGSGGAHLEVVDIAGLRELDSCRRATIRTGAPACWELTAGNSTIRVILSALLGKRTDGRKECERQN